MEDLMLGCPTKLTSLSALNCTSSASLPYVDPLDEELDDSGLLGRGVASS
jgi:hypothetical protein